MDNPAMTYHGALAEAERDGAVRWEGARADKTSLWVVINQEDNSIAWPNPK